MISWIRNVHKTAVHIRLITDDHQWIRWCHHVIIIDAHIQIKLVLAQIICIHCCQQHCNIHLTLVLIQNRCYLFILRSTVRTVYIFSMDITSDNHLLQMYIPLSVKPFCWLVVLSEVSLFISISGFPPPFVLATKMAERGGTVVIVTDSFILRYLTNLYRTTMSWRFTSTNCRILYSTYCQCVSTFDFGCKNLGKSHSLLKTKKNQNSISLLCDDISWMNE